jgi:tricarballylate dehydrogenase
MVRLNYMGFKQKRKYLEGAGSISLPEVSKTFDVLIIGGGNAALCAAMTAREAGCSVLLLECSPKAFRGGNSRHTRNLRCAHEEGHHPLTGIYPEEEFWDDLLSVTKGETDETLARLTIRESHQIGRWMEKHGCRFQPAMRGTLLLDRTNAFFLGGGKALINAYYATAERLGARIIYEAVVQDLEIAEGHFISALFDFQGTPLVARARAVVLASGGFQADLNWLKDSWGPPAENFIIRGTPYNRGRLLRLMLDRGAKPVGDPRQCHAVAIDARAPKFDGGIVTRLDCLPFGIVVNLNGQRFYDEGEDFWPKRYAIWGRLIAQQPDQIAYCLIDAKAIDLFMPSVFLPIEAGSIRAMAERLNLDPIALEETVGGFNTAVQAGNFNPSERDSCSTEGLRPPKSHWARRLDAPPFYAFPLRPGITFTYLGLTVNQQAQVIMQDNRPAENIFAAGEIMAGNILGQGYLAGFGMTIGTVFGRIAGKEAANHAVLGRKRS